MSAAEKRKTPRVQHPKKSPQKSGIAFSDAPLISCFQNFTAGAAKKQSLAVLIDYWINQLINSGPNILKSCLLLLLMGSWVVSVCQWFGQQFLWQNFPRWWWRSSSLACKICDGLVSAYQVPVERQYCSTGAATSARNQMLKLRPIRTVGCHWVALEGLWSVPDLFVSLGRVDGECSGVSQGLRFDAQPSTLKARASAPKRAIKGYKTPVAAIQPRMYQGAGWACAVAPSN